MTGPQLAVIAWIVFGGGLFLTGLEIIWRRWQDRRRIKAWKAQR